MQWKMSYLFCWCFIILQYLRKTHLCCTCMETTASFKLFTPPAGAQAAFLYEMITSPQLKSFHAQQDANWALVFDKKVNIQLSGIPSGLAIWLSICMMLPGQWECDNWLHWFEGCCQSKEGRYVWQGLHWSPKSTHCQVSCQQGLDSQEKDTCWWFSDQHGEKPLWYGYVQAQWVHVPSFRGISV